MKDHNCGVALRLNLHAYLTRRSRRALTYFRTLVADPRVAAILEEVIVARARRTHGAADEHRVVFDRLRRLQSRESATELASEFEGTTPRRRSRSLSKLL